MKKHTKKPEFKAFVHRNHRNERWFEVSKKLEGLPRHTSTHAAGIIINDQPLFKFAPLTTGDTGLLTQWTMTEAERIGLLKLISWDYAIYQLFIKLFYKLKRI